MTKFAGNGSYGGANSLYWAMQERWGDAADLMEAIADLEEALIHALGPAEATR